MSADLRVIVEALVDSHRGDEAAAARWLGAFDYDLKGRPIVLCETPEGRRAVLDAVLSRFTTEDAK